MNKKLLKVLAPSLMGIVLAGGVAAGATYALFTSEAKTNIAITSGKVNVAAEIQDLKVFSGEPDSLTGDPVVDEPHIVEQTGTSFVCGGQAILTGNTLQITRMAPGDRVSFKIKVTNGSNVIVKTRSGVKVIQNDGLFGGLKVTIDGDQFDGLTKKYSNWEVQDLDAEKISYLEVVVDFPSDRGNEYQELSCEMQFMFEAVQGNAYTEDPTNIEIENAAEWKVFTDLVNDEVMSFAGKTVQLVNDIDFGNAMLEPVNCGNWGMTFDGNDKTISNYKVEGLKNVGLFGLFTGNTAKDLTIDNATVTGINHVAALAGDGLCAHFDNITVKNSKVTTYVLNDDEGDKAGAVVGYLSAEPNASVKNSSVEDCEIKGYRDVGGLVGYANEAAVVTDNSVEDTVIINDRSNNYKNYTADAEYDVKEVIGEIANPTSATVSGNTFDNVTIKAEIDDGLEYDMDKTYTVTNANGLVKFSTLVNAGNTFAGKIVKLGNDINMIGVNWTPVGTAGEYTNSFAGTFDGQNKTISNLTSVTTGTNGAGGLFGSCHTGTIKNVILDNANISCEHFGGGIVGWFEGNGYALIDNCTVKNSTIVCNTRYTGTEWDDGDKTGSIAGYVCNSTVQNCTATNVTLTGYRDLGGIVGIANGADGNSATVKNNTGSTITLINDRTHNYKNYTSDAQYDVNDAIGEIAGNTLIEGNTVTGVIKQVIGA